MPFWPDLVFQVLPGFGLVSSCTSLVYLLAMRKAQLDGFFAAIYALRAMGWWWWWWMWPNNFWQIIVLRKMGSKNAKSLSKNGPK